MSKKVLLVFTVLMLATLVLSACGPKATEAPTAGEWGAMTFAPGTEVKIGVSSALAGGYAVYGQDMLNGVELAIADFGDLLGWTVIPEGGDDGCEGAPAVTVAERFVADPALLAVVGPMCSGSAVPASAIYDEHHVVWVSPSVTAVVVASSGYQNFFRTVANDALQAEVTVDFLSGDLGLKTLGIIHDSSIYGQGIADTVESDFEAAGGTVTAYEGITRGDTDFSAVVSNMLAGNPEAIYFGGMDAEGALLVNQLRTAGFEGVFFGPDGLKSKPTFIEGSGGAADNAYVTFGAVGGATGYADWEARFTEKYGAPVAYGPGSYDSATIILQAAAAVATIDADGNLVIDRKALADKIRSTPFDGITGHLEFTDTGDLAAVSITVFQVQNGDFAEMKKVDFGQ
ncbi:MAG TPA: branched-chain amino acid ABC transporter substrate-binding protein [Anaerolineales bacterium]|nr:branched-chain amino acid ABC transporter substrate-binding protein [Anaerolineales bacterium]